MKTASICTIGDEILIGQIIDTNTAAIARELNLAGIKVAFTLSISDNGNEIEEKLAECLEKTDIVIVTGGLGPTKDDITKSVLKKLSGSERYVENAEQLHVIREILGRRNIEISDINRAQSLVPDKCGIIVNENGTAPCLFFRKEGSILFSLPGVPYEAIAAIPKVISIIRQEYNIESICHRTINTFGIAESVLAKKIEKWEDSLPEGFKLAYLPNLIYGVKLRLSHYGGDNPQYLKTIEKLFGEIEPLLGDAIYGYEEDTLQSVIGKLLSAEVKTLSVAESCTGGTISSLITSVPGCSVYYKGSVTSYSNLVKTGVLGVRQETIDKYGAVSRECVEEMAQGVRKLMKTDFSVATSGIAGPGGGTEDKPVGLVWIAVSSENGTVSGNFIFGSQRKQNIERFAANALNMLRLEIIRTQKK